MVPTINVAEDLYRELGRFGNRDESWNDVVARVLEHVDEEDAIADKESRTTTHTRAETATSGSIRASGHPALRTLEDETVVRHRYQRGSYSGAEVEARVIDGRIEYDGTPHSPSRAAVNADQDLRDTDAMSSINGWTWWEYEDEDGNWVPIDTLRE